MPDTAADAGLTAKRRKAWELGRRAIAVMDNADRS